MSDHICLDGNLSNAPSWWERDGRGIELCRVCKRCRSEKLDSYRPEILQPYGQDDVNEPIEPDYGPAEERW